MQAVILAAGKSTRTYPLTVNMPKSLLPICNKPIIQYTLEALEGIVDDVVMIVGFGQEQLRAFCGERFGSLRIHYIEQTEQKGTGHALLMAKQFLGERFYLIYGDDLYAPEDIRRLAEYETAVLVREVENPKIFGVFEEENGCATALVEKPEHPKTNLANMGCYLLPSRIFDHELILTARGEYEATDYITYLIEQGEAVHLVRANQYWLPVGYPWDILSAQEFLLTEETHVIDPTAQIHPEAFIEGPVIIGKDVVIAAHANIRKSVIGEGSRIGECARIDNSALGAGVQVGIGSTVVHSVLGKHIHVDTNVHMLDNREDRDTISSVVKGVEVDTKRANFGCALGDAVRLMSGVVTEPGIKIWPDTHLAEGTTVGEDVI